MSNHIWHVRSIFGFDYDSNPDLIRVPGVRRYITRNAEIASACKLAGASVNKHVFYVYSKHALDYDHLVTAEGLLNYAQYSYVYTTSDFSLVQTISEQYYSSVLVVNNFPDYITAKILKVT